MLNNYAVFNWSGGKDSALCLYKVLVAKELEIKYLLTTVNKELNRISMHGVREELLVQQSDRLNLPLLKVELPQMPSMDAYEFEMEKSLNFLLKEGITISVFGDIFLEDLRKYRERKLADIGFKTHFPLWQTDTYELVKEFIMLGFKAIVVCVNEKYLDRSFAGRIINEEFLKDLPPNVDPAGENGEYHSFVFDGPIYSSPILFEVGETVFKKYSPPTSSTESTYNCNNSDTKPFDTGFWYTDLIPV